MKACVLVGLCGLVLTLGGCSDQSGTAEKKVDKPVEAVTGQSALYRIYQVARSWAPDAQILRMNSIHVTEVPDVRGKAGAWTATLASEGQMQARVYTYSVVETEPNLHQGVFPSHPESWTGPGRGSLPFVIAAVKIDSDAAYKTALSHATEAAKQNQKQTISFVLEKIDRFTDPVWRVIWGESLGTSALSVYVDASTGSYLETMH